MGDERAKKDMSDMLDVGLDQSRELVESFSKQILQNDQAKDIVNNLKDEELKEYLLKLKEYLLNHNKQKKTK